MTLGFFLLTVGAIGIYSGIKGMSLAEIMRGAPASDSEPASLLSGLNEDATTLASLPGGQSPDSQSMSKPSQASGTIVIDGVPVAKWIAVYVKKARSMGWTGHVTSGYRTPAQSVAACQNMCGADSCPGQCAGTSSNHSGKRFPNGAVDVSEYDEFGRIMRQINAPLKNDLPADRVHFSFTGH